MVITEQYFNQIIRFIENDTGIRLPDTNYRLIKRFVSERLSSLEMNQDTYLAHIKENKAEYDRFLDAITINETYFFREQKHFKIIDKIIFPQYANTRQDPLAFWSAACSTGEEAISIAALAEKFWGQSSENTYSVFASDLNPRALEAFKKGEFRPNSFREDGSCFHHLLKPFIRHKDGLQILGDSLKQNIRIYHINLLSDDFSRLSACFNIVFLRNMLIYIPIKTRQKILDKIVRKMANGGYLFLSSSETPLVSHQDLKLADHQGVYFFQKKNIRDKKQGCLSDQKLFKEIGGKRFTKKTVTEVFPGEKKEKYFVNVEEITFFVNQKLNNRLFFAEDNINYSLAIQFIEIVFLINSNKFSKAREQLEAVGNITVPNEISFYLSGYLDMAEQNEEKAVRQFSKALNCNVSFWPARFYLGMLFQKSYPRKARIEFEMCQRSISSYLEKDSYSYQFLLEGFNAKYFFDICRKWVKKLET
ncbi:CheR family methyltransferase [Desulfococcaceae bacterium HSG8]|nr:CheR family methyltransferase [Desulfococcaceae bacterium HSG8]